MSRGGIDASNGEDNVKGVVNTANVTSVEEGNVNATSSGSRPITSFNLVDVINERV
jgi:hypothetical protein